MTVKFNSNKDLLLWLSRVKNLKRKPIDGIIFHRLFGLEFNSESDFLNYLESISIIETIFKGIEFKNQETKLIEYTYEVDSIILNTNALDALESNKFSPLIDEKLLTIQDVCIALRLTKPSIYKLFDSGQLPYYTILSQKKVRYSDLLRFIEQNKGK